MQLKIQTKPDEAKMKTREPAKISKAFGDLSGATYSVLGVPYGGPFDGRDSDGQYFSTNTDTWLMMGDEIPVTYYHGFGPDDPRDWQDPPVVIGSAKYVSNDTRGHWFDVKLDAGEPLANRITSTKADMVKASSGAVGHLVRASEDGELTTWPIGELALFDINDWRKPANDFAVFMAKGEQIAEDSAKAQSAQPESVDDTPAIIEESLTQENIMDETTEVKAESPAVDLDAVMKELASIKAMYNEKPLNAPTIIKAENLGSPEPGKAFMHYLRTGEHTKGLKAAMGEGTAGVGGYLVPDDFYAGIVEKRNELSIPRRAGAMILQTSRDVLNIPVEATSQTYFTQSSHDMAAVSENEPTIGQVAVNVYAFTKLVKVSEDLLDDSAANLNQFLANSFGRWAAMTENRCALIGAGTTAPQGVTVGGTAALTFDDTNSIGAAEIPELYHKLAQAYRPNACWVLNDDTVAYLRGLTSQSVFTFGPHEIDDERIMNKPYYTSTYMPVYSTTANKSIVFGDWSLYALVERRGLVIRRLNELYAGNRQVGLLATMRFGGAVLQAEAFAVAKQA